MNTELNTRIILRNDSTVEWNAHSSAVLYKGEVGIEFFPRNPEVPGEEKITVKIKIGDGQKTWEQLDYVVGDDHVIKATPVKEETDLEAIQAVITKENIKLQTKDIAIVNRKIGDGPKEELTAYVYDGANWTAMDGNYNAANVYFDKDLLTTTAIGNISLTNGQGTAQVAGKNLLEAWETIFVKEDKNISITQPSASISGASLKYLEIGKTGSQTISVNFADGSYEYGYAIGADGTPVVKEKAKEGDAANSTVNNGSTGATASSYSATYNGQALSAGSATNSFVVDSGTKSDKGSASCTANATYSDGYVPVSNLKKMYPAKTIVGKTTGNASAELFRWYVPMYAGFKYSNALIAAPGSITASEVKGLGAITGATAYNQTVPTSATAAKAWRQYFVAVPAAYGKKAPSVLDSNNLPLTVAQATDVELTFDGDIKKTYNVWYINLAADYDTKKITIKW